MSLDKPPKPTLITIKKITDPEDLDASMMHIFNDCQFSLAGHKKLLVLMRSVFNRALELNLLDYFSLRFTQLLNHTLKFKKGEPNADRVAKFVAHFVRSGAEEAARIEELHKEEQGDADEAESNYTKEEKAKIEADTEFVSYLIRHLLRGIEASNKSVRYRVVQLFALIIKYMGDLDADIFQVLIISLYKRLNDREVPIRMQAVIALASFQYFDINFDEDEEPDVNEKSSMDKVTNDSIIEWLMTCLQLDDSAEVRRTAMLNTEKSKTTINLLLERVKDINSINRRIVFSKIMPELGGMTSLKAKHREILLQYGLNDRDKSVAEAAIKLLCNSWFDSCEGDLNKFLELLNVTRSQIAEKAISTLFTVRPEVVQNIEITPEFWKSLTIESSYLMRAFFAHCNEHRLYKVIETNFPDPLELADTLSKYLQMQNNIKQNNIEAHKSYDGYIREINDLEDAMFECDNSMAAINLKLHACVKKLQVLESSEEVLGESRKAKSQRRKEQKQERQRLQSEVNQLEQEFKEHEEEYRKCFEMKSIKLNRLKANRGEFVDYIDMRRDLKFIARQLLAICIDFDFSDEVGRRAMLNVIRTQLHEENNFEQDDVNNKASNDGDDIVINALKVLRRISINVKDFVTMTVEIITDIRDSTEGTESEDIYHSAANTFDGRDADTSTKKGDTNDNSVETNKENGDVESSTSNDSGLDLEDSEDEREFSHKKRRTEPSVPNDEILLRCLKLTKHSLELIDDNLDHHLSLRSIYSGLVNFALTRTSSRALYLTALECLGLYALIDESIAKEALVTFFNTTKTSGEEVKLVCITGIIDIISTFGINIIARERRFGYLRLFYKILSDDSSKLRALMGEGISKLFLADIFMIKTVNEVRSDNEGAIESNNEVANAVEQEAEKVGEEDEDNESEKELFVALLLSYFNSSTPGSSNNHELKQVLSFCIPVYCFSHPNHQLGLASVSGDLLLKASETTNLKPGKILPQLIDWANPQNLAQVRDSNGRNLVTRRWSHIWQALYIIEVFEVKELGKEYRRAIINNLAKIQISIFERDDDINDIQYLTDISALLQKLVDEIDRIKDILDVYKDDFDYQIDRLTMKNLLAFHDSTLDKLDIVKKKQEDLERYKNRSQRSSASPNGFRSRDNSVSLTDEAIIVGQDRQASSTPTKIKQEPKNVIEVDADDEIDIKGGRDRNENPDHDNGNDDDVIMQGPDDDVETVSPNRSDPNTSEQISRSDNDRKKKRQKHKELNVGSASIIRTDNRPNRQKTFEEFIEGDSDIDLEEESGEDSDEDLE
ncbi:Ycg1 condensin G [Candida orthopsilosis Co 90-125]|uniref:Ycg1 condensin G n=1 Tax=Candida orthopsilosis (strain 90-125) TaxID=1136231 RepID=H8X2V7_CANO9|nr:Ycg1 condensin G [Candida orthopsilosis Co 90-125]CCG25817.1 Ycg1 condensin G [Candida orthopsilosis Co 90-125]